MFTLHKHCDKKYLLLPIAAGEPLEEICIYADGRKIYDFKVPVWAGAGTYQFQFYAPVPLKEYAGSLIEMEGDVGDAFREAVCFSDSVPQKADSHPAIHFSANTGWLNDPNGFYYDKGVYHLYFQHNPFDTAWENMCWGHAVSRDLLHWEQQETVLYPDEGGTMFSGSAIINEKGLLDLPPEYPVFFYTSAGNQSHWSKEEKFVQKLAYSPDDGKTLVKTGITAVPHIAGDNRDPKIYWHEESKGYYMVLYLEENDFAILRSGNLSDWTLTQRITLDNAWECPDLFQVPVEGGGDRWVFWCADGYYYLGDFDGYKFTQTSGKMQAYATKLPYAAQTCWGEKRVISIPWLRTANENSTYTGTMGLPRELSLAEQNEVLRLRLKPVRELAEHREKLNAVCGEGGVLHYHPDGEQAVELVLALQDESDFTVAINGVNIRYEAKSRMMCVTGCKVHKDEEVWWQAEKNISGKEGVTKEITLDKAPEKVSVLADHEIMEITVDDGLVCAFFEIPFSSKNQMMEISVEAKGETEAYRIL